MLSLCLFRKNVLSMSPYYSVFFRSTQTLEIGREGDKLCRREIPALNRSPSEMRNGMYLISINVSVCFFLRKEERDSSGKRHNF